MHLVEFQMLSQSQLCTQERQDIHSRHVYNHFLQGEGGNEKCLNIAQRNSGEFGISGERIAPQRPPGYVPALGPYIPHSMGSQN